MYSIPVIPTRLPCAYSIICFLVHTTASSVPSRSAGHEDDTSSRLTENSAGSAIMDQPTSLPFNATKVSLDLLADLCNKMGSRHLLDTSSSPPYEGSAHVGELGTTANVPENKMNELHERVFKGVLGLCISIVLLVTVTFVIILICIRRHGWHRKRRASYMREESILMPRRAV